MTKKETLEVQPNSPKGTVIAAKKDVIQSLKKRKKTTEFIREYLRDK